MPQATYPRILAGSAVASSYLVLLRTGFTEPAVSPRQLVGSYPTFSPLPCTHFNFRYFRACHPGGDMLAVSILLVRTWKWVQGGLFLWHFPEVTPAGRYPASYPVEPGLSSLCPETTERQPVRLHNVCGIVKIRSRIHGTAQKWAPAKIFTSFTHRYFLALVFFSS